MYIGGGDGDTLMSQGGPTSVIGGHIKQTVPTVSDLCGGK